MNNKKYSIVKDSLDLRDKIFVPSVIKNLKDLPKLVDLRPLMSPIADQQSLGSCTSHGIVTGLREYLELRDNKVGFQRLSRLFLYYHERLLEGTVNEDSGAEIRDGMKVLQQIGVPPEYLDPYIISHFKNKPSILAEKAAAKYKISKYYRVNTLNDMKLALAEGLPVVIGIAVYDSFESDEVAKTGIVPMPNINTENLLGGHCMCISGFDDSKQWVITRNSWSTNWGDKGYCYLPYSFIIDSNLTIDMWTGF